MLENKWKNFKNIIKNNMKMITINIILNRDHMITILNKNLMVINFHNHKNNNHNINHNLMKIILKQLKTL